MHRDFRMSDPYRATCQDMESCPTIIIVASHCFRIHGLDCVFMVLVLLNSKRNLHGGPCMRAC